MTLTVQTPLVQYEGDGSTVSFAINFVFWDASDLSVTLTTSGVDAAWTLNTEYTVTGGNGATGTLLVDTSPTDYTPADGTRLTIEGVEPYRQPLKLPVGGDLPSKPLESRLDRIVRMTQQLSALLGRAATFPASDPTSISNLVPTSSSRASKYAAWDASGNWIAADGTVTIPNDAEIWCGTATGTADAIVLTPANPISALTDGLVLRWQASSSANTGAMSIAVSGLSEVPAQINGAALTAGQHIADKYFEGLYVDGAVQIQQISTTASSVPAASATVSGIVELATTAETQTGTDATRAVTPDGLNDMTDLTGKSWFLDEDGMNSDDATKVASQQSTKAYVDTAVAAVNTGGSTLMTEQTTTSGTSVNFTSIPSGTTRIEILFEGVSTNGSNDLLIQIGDSGGLETSGYVSGSTKSGTASTHSSGSNGFVVRVATSPGMFHGVMTLILKDAANNTWTASHQGYVSGDSTTSFGGGTKSLSAELDRLTLLMSGGDTFDAGSVNVRYY